MAGIALKRSVRLCFHNGPSRGVFERKECLTKRKKILISTGNMRNAAYDMLHMEGARRAKVADFLISPLLQVYKNRLLLNCTFNFHETEFSNIPKGMVSKSFGGKPHTPISLSLLTVQPLCFKTAAQSLPGPLRRGVEGVKGPGPGPLWPVSILCHKILLLLYISAVHFYGNLSALKGYLQEPLSLMTNSFHVRNQTIVLIETGSIPASQSLVS